MSDARTTAGRVYVAGHRGLAGSSIVRALQRAGYPDLVTRTHAELDLIDQAAVRAFFEKEKPEVVVLAAAKVGGILANRDYPGDFAYQNLAIQTNVIEESRRAGVRRLLFLGSSCIYPRECPQPIKEEYLLTGPLEPTNQAYAIAKIAGIQLCAAYNHQHGTQYLCVMPTNLYGVGDNYDLTSSHVLPALIRKAHDAKERGSPSMVVWGTGQPRREFLCSDDLGEACALLLGKDWAQVSKAFPRPDLPLLNVGCGQDLTIAELAQKVRDIVGFKGTLEWDRSKPDGTPQKLLDVSRMRALGWEPRIELGEGIRVAYQDFLKSSAASSRLQ